MKIIAEALQVLRDEHIGDFVYTIRERAREDDPDYLGDLWDHPRVRRWVEACRMIEEAG